MTEASQNRFVSSSLGELQAPGAINSRSPRPKQRLLLVLYRSGEAVDVNWVELEQKLRELEREDQWDLRRVDTRKEENAGIWNRIGILPGTPKLVLLDGAPENPQWPWKRVGPTLPGADADAVEEWLVRCKAVHPATAELQSSV